MKKFAHFAFAFLFIALRLAAQTNEPVRLALLPETGDAATASDILTAQLTGNPGLQLLERAEIEKVYREQGASAANQNDLKLGRILGADGLFIMGTEQEGTNKYLYVRLTAVKPGVVLVAEKFLWTSPDLADWSSTFAKHLALYLPKLAVLPKDAIPISVVNLRSAVQSDAGRESEKQLKLLAIMRLSREPRFFVLERQKMQSLGEEKELKSDESAFWDGSYLLDGVVDENGYSSETITINARLTPSKGGAPLQFTVSGSRTNLIEVIDQLAAKVNEALKINSTAKEWNSADEAQRYFEEATWALRWQVFSEAAAAADSAWALGKTDLDCATLRVRSYVSELSEHTVEYQPGEASIGPSIKMQVPWLIKRIVPKNQSGTVYQTYDASGSRDIHYVYAETPPNPENIDRALHALEIYYDFSRTSPGGLLEVGSETSGWKNSDWYELGIEDLTAVSRVLQNFNFNPESQKPVADNLAELRARARTVADWISQTPEVHDTYFVGDRLATYDELAYTIGQEDGRNPNIFSCKVKWGCFWQERPEDCVALYRELMGSPVFCYLHKDFWFRPLEQPRLVAWDDEGRQRIPALWNNFIGELDDSTNVLLQLEAKALLFADATNDVNVALAFTNFFDTLFANRDALVANKVDVLYLNWGADNLVRTKLDNGIASDTRDSLDQLFRSQYSRKLMAMQEEYLSRTLSSEIFYPAFQRQKQYLGQNRSFNFFEFVNVFQSRNYSKKQALELQPLLAAFKSNLVAQSQAATGQEKSQLKAEISQIGFFLENDINRILHSPAPVVAPPIVSSMSHPMAPPVTQPMVPAPKPPLMPRAAAAGFFPTNAAEIASRMVTVNHFLAMPLDGLPGDQVTNVSITAHHWLEGRLVLDFRYSAYRYSFDKNGNWKSTAAITPSAIAILDPATEHWDVIGCPEADLMGESRFYHRTTLLHGELFTCDGGQIRKYDFQHRQWQVLPISDGGNYELFAVDGRLYAANADMIFEILDGGKSTRILASNRRQPPASVLDSEELGTPALFTGPGHTLRVSAQDKIFDWTGGDWREVCAAPPVSPAPVISDDGVLFVTDGFYLPPQITHLAAGSDLVEFYMGQRFQQRISGDSSSAHTKPLWTVPPGLSLFSLAAAVRESDLYLLADHSTAQDVIDERLRMVAGKKFIPKDGYHAALLCFFRGLPKPAIIPLKFDAPNGVPPVTGADSRPATAPVLVQPAWMLFTTNFVFFGLEAPRGGMFISGENPGYGYQAGVWSLSSAQIDSAIAGQKQILLDRLSHETAAKESAIENVQKEFLAKYDLNHNGVLDPEEKEQALDDPAFIEAQLDVIDANQNDALDAEELAWFDVNQNKILDPKEQAGIEIARRLLAGRLLKKYDASGKGYLDREEFRKLRGDFNPGAVPVVPAMEIIFKERNVEIFLEDRLNHQLRGTHASAAVQQLRQALADGEIDHRQYFKALVESYWQNGSTNHEPQPGQHEANP